MTQPKGTLVTRTQAMPKDTNTEGDIFGGWLLSQMDIAGNITAKNLAKGRTVTIALNAMEFHKPVYVGDIVNCYATIEKTGRSSVHIHVEAWVTRQYQDTLLKVTEGTFTFVAIDENRKPVPIQK